MLNAHAFICAASKRMAGLTVPPAINPFVWQDAVSDPSRIVGMDAFADLVARRLKGHANVALFGPRGTGKTTFTVKLTEELARVHGPDGPPHDVVYVNLQWAFSV